MEIGAFQVHSMHDFNPVPQRIHPGRVLKKQRHAADRRRQARQESERHVDHEGIKHGLLHRGRDRRNEKSDSHRGYQEQSDADVIALPAMISAGRNGATRS